MDKQAYFKLMDLDKRAVLDIDTSTQQKERNFLRSPSMRFAPQKATTPVQRFVFDKNKVKEFGKILSDKANIVEPSKLQLKAFGALPKPLQDIVFQTRRGYSQDKRSKNTFFPATMLIKYLSSPEAKYPANERRPRNQYDKFFTRFWSLPAQKQTADKIANKWRNRVSSPWNFIKYMTGNL